MQRRIDHVFIYAIAQVLFIFFVMRLQKKKIKNLRNSVRRFDTELSRGWSIYNSQRSWRLGIATL